MEEEDYEGVLEDDVDSISSVSSFDFLEVEDIEISKGDFLK